MFSVAVCGGLAGATAGTPAANVTPPPTTVDEFWQYVVLLTRFTDDPPIDRSINGHTLTDGGAGAEQDTTDFRFPDSSWSMDNSSTGYVSAADHADFDLGAADFTIEAWVRFDADPGATDDSYFVSQWDETSDERGWALLLTNDTIVWKYSTDGTSGTVASLSAAWTPVDEQWYSVVVTRTLGLTRIRIDGELVAVGTDAATYHDSSAQLRLGTPVDTADGNFQRNLDEVRITNGVARYE